MPLEMVFAGERLLDADAFGSRGACERRAAEQLGELEGPHTLSQPSESHGNRASDFPLVEPDPDATPGPGREAGAGERDSSVAIGLCSLGDERFRV